jgi:hypothetical protein
MLRVKMACGIAAKDTGVDFTGGDNFKPLFIFTIRREKDL